MFTNHVHGGPINQSEWPRKHWYGALSEFGLRPRKFYATRHTFISIALTRNQNVYALAKHCGNSVPTIERHYGKYLNDDFAPSVVSNK